MEAFFEAFQALAQTRSIWIYLAIFFGKMLEVSTATLRIVLINRGIRLVGSLISIVEIILWLLITSTVLSGFQSDPWKMVVYAAAFACGCALGSWLDDKLAFGLSSIQIVVSSMLDAKSLTRVMRDKGYGITTMEVHGIEDQTRYMMLVMTKRKRLHEAIELINRTVTSAVITVSDVKVQKGGYLRNNPGGSIQSPVHKKPHWPWEERKASAAAAPAPSAPTSSTPASSTPASVEPPSSPAPAASPAAPEAAEPKEKD